MHTHHFQYKSLHLRITRRPFTLCTTPVLTLCTTRRPFLWHSVEGQLRQLADLAFLLQAYDFAAAT